MMRPVPPLLLAAVLAVVLVSAGCGSAAPATFPPGTRSGCFGYRVTTDRAAYAAGAAVEVTVTARNVTGRPCTGKACGGITGGYVVTDSRGADVYRQNGAGVMCVAHPPPPPTVAPAGTIVFESFEWDGRGGYIGVCRPGDCHLVRDRVPAGRYRIVWSWMDAVRVESAWFTLGAAPGAA